MLESKTLVLQFDRFPAKFMTYLVSDVCSVGMGNILPRLVPQNPEPGVAPHETRDYMELNGWKEAKEYLDAALGRSSDSWLPNVNHSEAYMANKVARKSAQTGQTPPFLQPSAVPELYTPTSVETKIMQEYEDKKRMYSIAGPLAVVAGVAVITPKRLGVLRVIPGLLPASVLRSFTMTKYDREMTEALILNPDVPLGKEMRQVVRRRFPKHPLIQQFDAGLTR